MTQNNWIEAILTVQFDLEEGQVVESCYPAQLYPENLLKLIGYFSFPDSYVLTNEGDLFYCYQLKFEKEPIYCYSLFTQKKDSSNARGYFQKSIVVVSKHRLVKIFRIILNEILKKSKTIVLDLAYFSNFFESINANKCPKELLPTNEHFTLKLPDSSPKVFFNRVHYSVFRFSF